MIKINKTVEQSFYIPAILLGLVLFTAVASIVFTNVRYFKFSMVADVDGKPVDDVYVSNYSKSAVPGEAHFFYEGGELRESISCSDDIYPVCK